MTEPKTPKARDGLFPSTWIVGQAAASLARDDEGVLLADEFHDPLADNDKAVGAERAASPAKATGYRVDGDGVLLAEAFDDPLAQPAGQTHDAGDGKPSGPAEAVVKTDAASEVDSAVAVAGEVPTETGAAPADPVEQAAGPIDERSAPEDPASPVDDAMPVASRRAQEIAELVAANERLRRRQTVTRQSLRPLARRVDEINAGIEHLDSAHDGPDALSAEMPAALRRGAATRSPLRRVMRLLLILVVCAGLGAAWLVSDRLGSYEGPWQARVEALRADMSHAVSGFDRAEFGRGLDAALERATLYADWLGERIAMVWSGSAAGSDESTEPVPTDKD